MVVDAGFQEHRDVVPGATAQAQREAARRVAADAVAGARQVFAVFAGRIPRMPRSALASVPLRHARWAGALLLALLAGCATQIPEEPTRGASAIRADLPRPLPAPGADPAENGRAACRERR